LDQRRLPGEEVYLDRTEVEDLFSDIRSLAVRGAPAIGVAAAYGVVLGIQTACAADGAAVAQAAEETARRLAESRPTAVNLFTALDRMTARARALAGADAQEAARSLLAEAHAILEEDLEISRCIGRHGAVLIRDGFGVLTHCNAGGLATSGYGTALGVIYAAWESGLRFRVYADETRPLLQGARLTAWELVRSGLDVVLMCDNAAGWAMCRGMVDLVVVGADRIAANGDAANKIGTYSVAVLAARHDIPFYVAAPSTTFDLSVLRGGDIPIEQRSPEEVFSLGGVRIAPEGVGAFNPAFDVTPADLITGIVTEKGILRPPYRESITAALG
jgi:methylthioribose-1-phosphate isomerase